MQHEELVLLGAEADIALEALRWTEDACNRSGLDAALAGELAAAVIEAVNNALEHGYRLEPGNVMLTLASLADRVVVTVTDSGTGMPAAPRREPPAPLAERGRGSLIMQRACDEVRHEIRDGFQSVVLTKRRRGLTTQTDGGRQ
jgi:anti-sigma regulatory factor (Ser/Thr protein kinase)